MPKITKRGIDALPASDGVVRILWDSETKGFGLVAQAGGARAFVVQYRTEQRRQRRLTLGRYGVLTVDEARKAAIDVLARVAKGEDPLAIRIATRSASTMNDLFDRYVSDHVEVHNAASTHETVRFVLQKHLRPGLGALKVNAVTRADVAKLHAGMRSTPRHANMALSVLSKALALAEIWGLRPEHSNPVRGVARYPETRRTRFLSGEEIGRLGRALREAETEGLPWDADETKPKSKHLAMPENRRTKASWQSVAAIHLLLFTGARLSEILGLAWSDVDLEAGMIALPGKKGRRREPHPAGLHVLQLLGNVPKAPNATWVLPRESDPSRHLAKEVLDAFWRRLRKRAGLEDVHLHDLRHTVGTYASQSGANAFAVRDLLRHATVAMTGRYANFDNDPVRAISNVVGSRIAAAIAEGSAGGRPE